jgi:hypothetical protein
MLRRDEVNDIAGHQEENRATGGGTYYPPSHYVPPPLEHSSTPQVSSKPAISSCTLLASWLGLEYGATFLPSAHLYKDREDAPD